MTDWFNTRMKCFWIVLLIVNIFNDSVEGMATSFECYECSNRDECIDAPLKSCFSDQDVCTIVASWEDDSNEMQIIKRCDSLDRCPGGNTTHCDRIENGFRCKMCCLETRCNNGAVGSFPGPPEPPPIPEYKVNHCNLSEEICETSAIIEQGVIHINKICSKGSTESQITDGVNLCNAENTEDLCVTCCGQDCFNNNNDSYTSISSGISITVWFLAIYFGLTMQYFVR